jgi:hypothetical protein
MIGVPEQKAIEANFRGMGPVGFEKHAASREVDDSQAGVESDRLIVISLREVPFLMHATQFATSEIELRILWVFRNLFREVVNLFVQIAVREKARWKDCDGDERNADDP